MGLWSRKVLESKLDYIHHNPVQRGLVEKAEDWQDSSFRQLELDASGAPFLCDPWDDIWM